ncbi:MAG: sigma-54 dependent transcriptional regulator [Paludibacter sp.]
MEDKQLSILIIDDDPIYRRLSGSILKDRFNVFTAEMPSLGFDILKKHKIDFVICDYLLPQMNGIEVLEKLKKDFPHIETIMISDSGNMDTVIEALRRGAIDYFKKPFTPTDIWLSIERTMKYSELKHSFNNEKNKNLHLKELVDREMGVEMIGKSPIITDIKSQMRLVAQTPDTSVLILGESGTGKELVAKGIHNMSSRKDEFFGAVNMSAVSENLFESEFFGHKKGSFTGAISDKAGWFETSDKGTLFLDEIGEINSNLQVKLLRVLEDRTFTKVGTQSSKSFDVRIIAATNKSVEEISTGQNFRLDLYHRIGTFIIHLPPLRDRKDDIPELVDYFLNLFSKKMGKNISKVHNDVYDILKNYNFPGNIRELRNLMERATILCSGKELYPDNFTLSNKFERQQNNIIGFDTFNLEEIEKQTIIKALSKTNNNKAEAARLLNVEWNALHRRLKKFNLEI